MTVVTPPADPRPGLSNANDCWIEPENKYGTVQDIPGWIHKGL